MLYLTIGVTAAVCLLFASTRLYGVLGSALLFYLYPAWALVALCLAVPVLAYLYLKT
jgi:hypothetical protein